MPSRDPFVDELVEQLAALGAVYARRMFGGFGLYCDEVFFGVVDEGVAFFRVDDTTVEAYRAAGSTPFRPIPNRPPMMGYWEVPVNVLERDEELRSWAARAVQCARALAAAKGRKKKVRQGGRAGGEKQGGSSRSRTRGATGAAPSADAKGPARRQGSPGRSTRHGTTGSGSGPRHSGRGRS